MTSVPTTKDLASEARAGRFSQERARHLQERFVRRNLPLLLLVASVILVPSTIAAAFASGVLRGVLIGASLATTAGVLIHCTVLLSGSGPAKMGTLAEQWTVQELKVVQGHGYFLINGAFLRGGDLDHVLVGPGGVFLLETKWSAQEWRLDPGDRSLHSAVSQVMDQAARLNRWLGALAPCEIEAIVVLWGNAARAVRDGSSVRRSADGKTVIMAGDALAEWTFRRGRDRLTADQVDAIVAKFAAQVARKDAADGLLPRSLEELLGNVVKVIGSAMLGVFGPVGLARLFHSSALVGESLLAALLAAAVLRRRPAWRAYATAFSRPISLWIIVVLLGIIVSLI